MLNSHIPKPRAATSVATKIGALFPLNSVYKRKNKERYVIIRSQGKRERNVEKNHSYLPDKTASLSC